MPSLKEFVAALQAGWFPALVAMIGCAIIIAGDYYQVPYLANSPDLLLTLAVVVGVFSASILVAQLAYLPIALTRRIRRRASKEKFRQLMRSEVLKAPGEEKAILAYLVTTNRKAFVAKYDDLRLAPLVVKGLVSKMPGTHSVLEWPYSCSRRCLGIPRRASGSIHY